MAELTFKYGAMGSGKTMDLMRTAHNYRERGFKVFVLKPLSDTKGGSHLTTRAGLDMKIDAYIEPGTHPLGGIEDWSKMDLVLIDEAQFLDPEQIDMALEFAHRNNVPIVCYGLRTNYRMTDDGFEGATRLLQIADNVWEIPSVCECGAKATINARFQDGKLMTSGEDIVIDDGSSRVEYRGLCCKCYNKFKQKSVDLED